VAVLFPPFENFAAITKAALPTFEGFHFIFGDNPMRQIVTSILYIEVALILVNGALLWLLFRDKTTDEIAAEQRANSRQDEGRNKRNSTSAAVPPHRAMRVCIRHVLGYNLALSSARSSSG
jgi:hypothetical protein